MSKTNKLIFEAAKILAGTDEIMMSHGGFGGHKMSLLFLTRIIDLSVIMTLKLRLQGILGKESFVVQYMSGGLEVPIERAEVISFDFDRGFELTDELKGVLANIVTTKENAAGRSLA